jgi:hypothetical protein
MEEKNVNIAIRLARLFSEDSDLPARLKNKEDKKDKTKTTAKSSENSGIEQRFQENIKSWEKFITTMKSKIDTVQAVRFLNINPKIEPNIANAAHCRDFHEFTEYFILRRDKENCDNEELGKLAQLYTAFQKEIDRRIGTDTAS